MVKSCQITVFRMYTYTHDWSNVIGGCHESWDMTTQLDMMNQEMIVSDPSAYGGFGARWVVRNWISDKVLRKWPVWMDRIDIARSWANVVSHSLELPSNSKGSFSDWGAVVMILMMAVKSCRSPHAGWHPTAAVYSVQKKMFWVRKLGFWNCMNSYRYQQWTNNPEYQWQLHLASPPYHIYWQEHHHISIAVKNCLH